MQCYEAKQLNLQAKDGENLDKNQGKSRNILPKVLNLRKDHLEFYSNTKI